MQKIGAKPRAIFTLLIILAAIAVWKCEKKITLVDLQKAMLGAETEAERQAIIDRLYSYYLSLPVDSSIHLTVKEKVARLVDQASEKHKSQLSVNSRQRADVFSLLRTTLAAETNPLMLEIHLQDTLRQAMIARVSGEQGLFEQIMQYAEMLADQIAAEMQHPYWPERVAAMARFDSSKAMTWLIAGQAERLCYRHHLVDFQKAEKFGALGLQYLQQAEDPRLYLDITQRLLVILYKHYSLYDLALPLAERGLRQSMEMQYHYREVGLTYNFAEALSKAGKTEKALTLFMRTVDRARKYSSLPGMDEYLINAWLGCAESYWQLGKFEEGLTLCQQFESFYLTDLQKILLRNQKGLIYMYLGKYQEAEQEYNKAFDFAITTHDTLNQLIVLGNLGTLNFHLYEFEKAKAYYQEALAILLQYDSQNLEQRVKKLLFLAETELALGEGNRSSQLLKEVDALLELIETPLIKGEYLAAVGELHMQAGQYQQAYQHYSEAIGLYEHFGLSNYALINQAALIQSLIELSNYDQAKIRVEALHKMARQVGDRSSEIDALGLNADIAFRQGHIQEAVYQSTRLIDEVETFGEHIEKLDHLISFRHKVHRYLKQAVFYEIMSGRIDSAFAKLDYLKSREARRWLEKSLADSAGDNFSRYMEIDTLRAQLSEQELLLNYLVTEDTIYTFLLDPDTLTIIKQPMAIEALRELANRYMTMIKQAGTLLTSYEPNLFRENATGLRSLAKTLYTTLLGSPEVRSRLSNLETLYVIPDDILYGIPFACLNDIHQKQPLFLIDQTAVVSLPNSTFLNIAPDSDSAINLRSKRVLISADREEFPEADELVKYIRRKFPEAEELSIDKPVIEIQDIVAKLNQGYDLYFFIGHSVPNFQFPDLSQFQLTALRGSDRRPLRIDIPLRAFKQIDWSEAEMVFLIGCETAAGKFYDGSGFAGFQQNILSRGAGGVLATMWKIDNKLAFLQLVDFLQAWEVSQNAAIALQGVETKWIQRLKRDPYYGEPHPYLWKIFTLSQNYKQFN